MTEIIMLLSLLLNIILLPIINILYLKNKAHKNKIKLLISTNKRARKIIQSIYQSGAKLSSQL